MACPAPNAPPFAPPPMFDGAFIRTEYLHWNLPNPGNVMLGSATAGTTDPTQPFDVFDPGTSNIIAKAYVPTLNSVNMADINGMRVTLGLDMTYNGSIEVGAFFLGTKKSGFEVTRFPETVVVNPDNPFSAHVVTVSAATTVLDQGQLGSTVFLYNSAYDVVYKSQLWGAEANWIGDYDRDGLFWFNPTLGFRYFNLSNFLQIHGAFQDQQISAPSITTLITSQTTNNLYGPQAGARLEMITPYVNMGLSTNMMFLGNTMFGSVSTSHLRSNADPASYTDDRTTSFSWGIDVGTYAQINVHENFRIRVGYNLIYLTRVTYPENNIYWNDNGVRNPPGIATNLTFHDFFVHGVSVGGELRF